MPNLENFKDTANFTPPDGKAVTFYTEENGKIVLKAKLPDGTVVTVMGGN